jgi:hypothetical protein
VVALWVPASRRTKANAIHISGVEIVGVDWPPAAWALSPSQDNSPATSPTTALLGPVGAVVTRVDATGEDRAVSDVVAGTVAVESVTTGDVLALETLDAVDVGVATAVLSAGFDDGVETEDAVDGADAVTAGGAPVFTDWVLLR